MTRILFPLLLLCVLYLWAIKPRTRNRPDLSPLLGQKYYAHRGLHDNRSDAPENSMAAFRKAVEAGYGIEFDVQLTKDRIPVVFHDETLDRVCGVPGKVRDFTFEELQAFSLLGTDQRIPRFSEFLKLVDGRVPLIVEIKVHEPADNVCRIIAPMLLDYKGVYCVESFHPMAVKWYREHYPQVIRGQLSSNFTKPDKKENLSQKAVHHLLTNFLCRPDFIAYDCRFRGNLSRKLCQIFKPLNVTWTVKSQAELDACRKDFDVFIFEGFIPGE
jgi:glycerophosphoryl diester phosphodiesterase